MNAHQHQIGDYFMTSIYWGLSIFWIITVSITASFYIQKASLKNTPTARRLLTGFLILGCILMLDSIYWAIATSARVEVLNKGIATVLYNSWAVASIKLLFLFSAITFLIILVRTFKEIDFQTEKLYFSQFVEQSIDAIGVLDKTGRVLYWNSGAEKLYGHHRNSVLGKHIKEFLVPSKYHQEIDKVINKIKNKTLTPERFIAPRLKADNTEIMVDITMSPFFVQEDFMGFFGIMRPFVDVGNITNSVTPIKLSEIDFYEHALTSESSTIQKIAESLKLDQAAYEKKKMMATIFAIALLFLTLILLTLSMFGQDSYRVYFGGGSVITLLGELWPLKFILTHTKENFKIEALKKILEDGHIDKTELEKALQIFDNINDRLK